MSCWLSFLVVGDGADVDFSRRRPQTLPSGDHCAYNEGEESPEAQSAHSRGKTKMMREAQKERQRERGGDMYMFIV